MSDNEWYFDTETGEAVQGKTVGWENRMGPYPSREAALDAYGIAERRNKAWDAQDEDD